MVSCMPVYGVYVPGICMPVLSFSAIWVEKTNEKTEVSQVDSYQIHTYNIVYTQLGCTGTLNNAWYVQCTGVPIINCENPNLSSSIPFIHFTTRLLPSSPHLPCPSFTISPILRETGGWNYLKYNILSKPSPYLGKKIMLPTNNQIVSYSHSQLSNQIYFCMHPWKAILLYAPLPLLKLIHCQPYFISHPGLVIIDHSLSWLTQKSLQRIRGGWFWVLHEPNLYHLLILAKWGLTKYSYFLTSIF